MDTITVPLNMLERDPLNVRHIEASKIDELAVSIKEHGLLLPLIVRPANTGYYVTAGGRRLLALKILVGAGVLPEDWQVPCRILLEEDRARELSLVENVMRQAMHPADLYAAFAKLKIGGQKNKEIAARFSLPEKDVRRVLALGKMLPDLLDYWRRDAFDYELATEICQLTKEQQHRLIANCRKQEEDGRIPEVSSWDVQEMLRKSRIYPTDMRVKVVGLEVYKNAGGAMGSDLFDEKDAYLTDGKLLDQLLKSAQKSYISEWKAKGWGTVRFSMKDTGHYAPAGCRGISEKQAKTLLREHRKIGGVVLTYRYDGEVQAMCYVPADIAEEIKQIETATEREKNPEKYEAPKPQFTIKQVKAGSKKEGNKRLVWEINSWTNKLTDSGYRAIGETLDEAFAIIRTALTTPPADEPKVEDELEDDDHTVDEDADFLERVEAMFPPDNSDAAFVERYEPEIEHEHN